MRVIAERLHRQSRGHRELYRAPHFMLTYAAAYNTRTSVRHFSRGRYCVGLGGDNDTRQRKSRCRSFHFNASRFPPSFSPPQHPLLHHSLSFFKMVYLGRKRRRSLDYDDRRRSSIDRDETEMNMRGRSGQAGPDLHPEPTPRDRLISAYRYYETKWNITADQRFLTRKEFEDISNQIHSVDIARIVAAARNWNYFLPGKTHT